MKKRYNLSRIMTAAWKIYRKGNKEITFSESLHRAWQSEKSKDENARRIEAAKLGAGVEAEEETHTYSEWQKLGFSVIHGSRCLFQAVLIWASRGDNKSYTASFFSRSQVEPIVA